MTAEDELPGPKPPEHSELDEKQNRVERGVDPESLVGTNPKRPQDRDPDPGWEPDPSQAEAWRRIASEIGGERKPRREDVYPYLLIRAVTSGDRGARPIWPPVACWESPDILLIDASYNGPFDPSRLVVSPVGGRSYRVFVRIWNLGLLPAMGVHVKAWAINPGFFGTGNQNDPYYEQHLIGGRWLELSDRTRPECTAVVECDQTWDIDPNESGHHCLLAEVSCPLDVAEGLLLSNTDRHVGQRNLQVMAGAASPVNLIATLGKLVPERFTLEVTHAGPAALGALHALGGGFLPGFDGAPHEIIVPELNELRMGVMTPTSCHLLTALSQEGRTLIARSDRLSEVASEAGGIQTRVESIFEQPGGVRQLLDQLGPRDWSRVGLVTDEPLGEVLGRGVGALFDIDELTAGELAQQFGGPRGAQHALRFTLTDGDGGLVGGYTIVVS